MHWNFGGSSDFSTIFSNESWDLKRNVYWENHQDTSRSSPFSARQSIWCCSKTFDMILQPDTVSTSSDIFQLFSQGCIRVFKGTSPARGASAAFDVHRPETSSCRYGSKSTPPSSSPLWLIQQFVSGVESFQFLRLAQIKTNNSRLFPLLPALPFLIQCASLSRRPLCSRFVPVSFWTGTKSLVISIQRARARFSWEPPQTGEVCSLILRWGG